MKKETKKISNMRERAHKRVDNIMDKAESMRKNGRERLTRLKGRTMMVKKNVDGYIQKNPEKSVLIASGVGIAGGAILTSSIKRRMRG
ncbi:MAG: hypothetical protein ACQESG_06930 [Nanobdellota archaeon]